ncbi:transcription-repair coupling factor (mfd) [Rubidibacter lacunae KORDI 51-2]|uniref:Transcription-repair-coupling factor n=1 Tax=Rubidibacter lacunae KORDI 51-2 TaxID=582515 RepID=U5DBH4_9CHRO|nr:transcription-repair coupling factor [Rubidibacter lacunae]ERN41893.1 transcription-repair coupling factor (mfd) [Rubidibacter lacunae KORDI 51-2]
MAFASIIRALGKSTLARELRATLDKQQWLALKGLSRFPKGLIASAVAQEQQQHLLVVCATLEEAGRWAAQLDAMNWGAVYFYPTSEASPYEPFDPESEMTWGQLQVLAELGSTEAIPRAIVATERALQPHLPPPEVFQPDCISLARGDELAAGTLDRLLARLGYERVPLVETEGQWSRRGDLVDVFPVSAELPVRLEWFGDELEKIREFDPAAQRSLDRLDKLLLTPTSYTPAIARAMVADPARLAVLQSCLTPEEFATVAPDSDSDVAPALAPDSLPEGMRRFVGVAFDRPASLLDYLPGNTLLALDEPDQCRAHGDRWLEHAEDNYRALLKSHHLTEETYPRLHRNLDAAIATVSTRQQLHLTELADESSPGIDLASRPLPVAPHQFGKLAEILRGDREIFSSMRLRDYAVWLVSAQPSRSVALLQEHDCPAQFVPNPRDFPAIDKLQGQNTPVAVKYSGLAELEGFVLPTFRIVVVSDREFFGQHVLASKGYVRKRRRAASKQVDVNKLRPGDFVVHRHHGIGKFLRLESLETREYLVVQYEDGLLRVPADGLEVLSRFRQTGDRPPELNKMSGKAWERTKGRVRKTVQKLAVDLLDLYAKRSQLSGYAYPSDTPWQTELEDSFPYQPTPDQLKAIQDVKRDLESDRPMDRLVCGDVGFGKTEVAIRAIFKVITSGKQVAFLAPTTILTQQHYHTLRERFAPYPIHVGLLNRFRSASERKEIVKRLATGELDVIVGTHQLLGKTIGFKDLGMLVIDEEQRFGVAQKEKVKALKTQVDVLTLTATPIPRTLYMSISGIREMSLIATPPPSRRPIATHLSQYDPEVIRTAIRNELDRGGQIFYVVPRVEGIEEIGGKLREMVPGARIAIAHGQMLEGELEATMLAFNNGDADILVCTTIIESGLDIPRVNTIAIEDAQKFGLSQLYQLRGRVGRAGTQAHAWLLYPQQHQLSDAARKRLRALQEFTQLGSGFQLAMRDMEIRGVGELLGAKQSGQMNAVGFDLYMSMLQEAIQEIQGQEIPQVEDTQIDLKLTAFIPSDYIQDLEQKMDAYRAVAATTNKKDLAQLAADWSDRYGPIPSSVEQLLKVVELKQISKSLGFSRIKLEGKQHVALETPMEEPAWKLLQANLPEHLKSRFVFSPKKVTVRGLGVLKTSKQLENLIDWLSKMQGALPETAIAS